MTNWFENNQTKSVIIYTVLVSGTTWTIFNVLLDDKKLASARAEVDQYKAKTEVLEAQVSQLRDENQKYQGWLMATPGTIPYFEAQLAKAKELASSVKAVAPAIEPNMSTSSGRAAVLAPGESMVDSITGTTVAAGLFSRDFTVDINITTPDGKTKSHPGSRAGAVWDFNYKSVAYRITLSRVDWYKNEATVSLRELQ